MVGNIILVNFYPTQWLKSFFVWDVALSLGNVKAPYFKIMNTFCINVQNN